MWKEEREGGVCVLIFMHIQANLPKVLFLNREPVVEHLWGSVCLKREQPVHRSAQHKGDCLRCSSSKKGSWSGEGDHQDGEGEGITGC